MKEKIPKDKFGDDLMITGIGSDKGTDESMKIIAWGRCVRHVLVGCAVFLAPISSIIIALIIFM